MASQTNNIGLPLYQDSDIPDLTNQYNAAMNILDSNLTQLKTDKAKCLLFGDSWAAPKENNDFLREFLGLDVVNYAVSGGMISGNVSGRDLLWQISQAEADANENVEVIILLMGVNDLQNGANVANIYGTLNKEWTEFLGKYPNARAYWFLDGPNVDQSNFTTYMETYKKFNYSYYNIQHNMPFVCANVIPYLYMLMNPGYYKEDKLHPTDGAGHQLVCRIMSGIIKYGRFPANTNLSNSIGIAQTYYGMQGDNIVIASNAAGSGSINAAASAVLKMAYPWGPPSIVTPIGTINRDTNEISIEKTGTVTLPIINRG